MNTATHTNRYKHGLLCISDSSSRLDYLRDKSNGYYNPPLNINDYELK